jgi:hypothetical protein
MTRRCEAGVRIWWVARAMVRRPVPGSPSSTIHSRLWKCRSTAWQHLVHSSPEPTAVGSADDDETAAGLDRVAMSGAASCTCSTPPDSPRSIQLGRT